MPTAESQQSKRQQLIRLGLIRRLREVISNQEREHREQIQITRARLHEEVASELGDRAFQNINQPIVVSTLRKLNEEFGEIQAAQDRFKQGTYGVCHECGEEIPNKRLEAAPLARLCIVCQEKTEGASVVEPKRHRQQDRPPILATL